MAGRNGAQVEPRLRECSLYDPNLDLAVGAPDGTVAGSALFWADPVTRVGVVEPMRVEEAHWGRGLATQLLRAGLRRLADHGCTRMKVIARASNPVALALYGGAGFCVTDVSRVWRYEPAGDGAASRRGSAAGPAMT
jgi:ribosomal protein S18 acetylase RimI-like enzyme